MSQSNATTIPRGASASMVRLGGGQKPSRRGTVGADPATTAPMSDARVSVLRDTLLALVRRDGRDLTARQLTAFLLIYTAETTHTVSTLADEMNISRPGVTRVMDRLVQFDLISREEDREDRRRVLARRTSRGATFFRELATLARDAAEAENANAAVAKAS